jgi:hypothetical protein
LRRDTAKSLVRRRPIRRRPRTNGRRKPTPQSFSCPYNRRSRSSRNSRSAKNSVLAPTAAPASIGLLRPAKFPQCCGAAATISHLSETHGVGEWRATRPRRREEDGSARRGGASEKSATHSRRRARRGNTAPPVCARQQSAARPLKSAQGEQQPVSGACADRAVVISTLVILRSAEESWLLDPERLTTRMDLVARDPRCRAAQLPAG